MIKSIEGYSYKINEYIGKGYSSTVHKGRKDSTGEDISIKVIEMGKLQDPINQMLLQYEVCALKSLTTSSNNLHLHDVYATKNNTYIITELMQGDLHTLLKQRKQFPYYQAVQITKQIITGYIDVYRAGYLHRDIKPANILYKNGVYKIGDFGFAIPAKDAHEHRHYNVGSPVYMPPQALKENKYSHTCDTWAIGVIFYQLLKGLVPWRAASEPKLYEKIMNEPMSQLTVGLPEIARTFLGKVLHLDQNNRMTPQELMTWPAKLFSVQIRSTTPGQSRPPLQKSPLQQIQANNNFYNQSKSDNYSRSKSYSSNQVPNYVSGLRININNCQSNLTLQQTQLNQQKITSNTLLPPPTSNHTLNTQNYQSTKHPTMQQNWQKTSNILTPSDSLQKQSDTRQNQAPNNNKKSSSCNSPQFYATNMLSYIKFLHKVIKFISTPTDIPLKDLEQSLTRTLFKEIQTVKKFTQTENSESLSQINGWKQFVASKACKQKLTKKLSELTQKYKMFHLLPKDEFVLEVYKEQLVDGILKIYSHLQNEANYSDKALISLDYLVSFYQAWDYRDKKGKNFVFTEFLDVSRFDKIMEISPYNVKKQHFGQLKNKMKSLELIENSKGLSQINVNLTVNQQQILKQFPQNKVRYQRVTIRY